METDRGLRNSEKTRVALLGIIVENPEAAEKINRLLHEHRAYIIGRMGIPYPEKHLNLISIALDAPQDVINSLSGKIGMLSGVSTKVTCAVSEAGNH